MRFLHGYRVDVLQIDRPQFFSFSANDVQGGVGPKFNFDEAFVVRVQPLLDDHVVVVDFAVCVLLQLFLLNFQASPPLVLKFHDSVPGGAAQDRNESQKDAGINVDQFVTLGKLYVSLSLRLSHKMFPKDTNLEIIVVHVVLARLQDGGVELHGLRTRIVFHPIEDILLYVARFDRGTINDDVPQGYFADLCYFLLGEHSGSRPRVTEKS